MSSNYSDEQNERQAPQCSCRPTVCRDEKEAPRSSFLDGFFSSWELDELRGTSGKFAQCKGNMTVWEKREGNGVWLSAAVDVWFCFVEDGV